MKCSFWGVISLEPLIGDLLLVRGNNWIDKEIECITHSTYSHVAIFTGPNELIEAQGFRRVGYQDALKYAGFSDVFRCDSLRPQDRNCIATAAKSHIGEYYDYLLVMLELLRYATGIILPSYEFHAVICSTLVADCYRTIGRDPCPHIKRPSQADLALSPLFHKVGALQDLYVPRPEIDEMIRSRDEQICDIKGDIATIRIEHQTSNMKQQQ